MGIDIELIAEYSQIYPGVARIIVATFVTVNEIIHDPC